VLVTLPSNQVDDRLTLIAQAQFQLMVRTQVKSDLTGSLLSVLRYNRSVSLLLL